MAAARAGATLATVAPFDTVLLGMGADGHVASLFARSPVLEAAMKRDAPLCLVASAGKVGPEQIRLSLSVRALAQAGHLLLVLRGHEKLDALARAQAQGDERAAPVLAVLRASTTPPCIMWAE